MMNIHSKALAAAVAIALSASASVAEAQSVPKFKDGDRVILIGDSITHCGHYHSYIWLYYMTRFPYMRIDMEDAGMGGECSWDMLARLEDEVILRNPTYVTLTFGMNDTGYGDVFNAQDAPEKSKQRVERSLESFRKMEASLAKMEGTEIVMIGGSPFDESSKFTSSTIHGKNDAMRAIIADQKRAAEAHGWGFVDFHDPMVEISRREQEKDSTFTFCRLDRVHPDCDGQMVMAYLFLKAQGHGGEMVADVSITSSGKVKKSGNCKISSVEKSPSGGISFDYQCFSLPFPVDSVSQNGWANKRSMKDAMEIIPFQEEFNREMLQVTGLKKDALYSLCFDGAEVARFTGAEFAAGVNLALLDTPQQRQAAAVMYLNEERLMAERRLVEYRWVRNEYIRKYGMLDREYEPDVQQKLLETSKKDFFLGISYNWYKQARDPRIRKVWEDQVRSLTDSIYRINRPEKHRICIEKTGA